MSGDPPGEGRDERRMARALDLARRGWGRTHPNPMVGALVEEDGTIVAEGWHREDGAPHAEVEALRVLGRPPEKGAALYVTLEPCSTRGRTGACTDAILEAGIRRVVVGARDPNPRHAGRGLEILRAAGVAVTSGVLEEACRDLNLIFNFWITRGRPLLAAKMALTLDGKFSAASGQSRWVTGAEARNDSMRWRRYFPAIAVGAGTYLRDNPRLTARIDGEPEWCPRRFLFDRELEAVGSGGLGGHLLTDAHRDRTTVVCGSRASGERKAELKRRGLSFWEIREKGEHIDWESFRERCAREGIAGVYLETGPRLATALLGERLADYVFVYQSPKFMADAEAPGPGAPRGTRSMDEALELRDIRRAELGDDSLVRGWLSS